MRLRTVLSLAVVTLTVSGVTTAAARPPAPLMAEPNTSIGYPIDDLISGEWEALCEIGGGSATLTLKLKLEGDKVTGTAESAHTGPGKVTHGSLVDNRLSFTLEFAAHESIAVDGSWKDGKLSGEFRTEGMVGKWVAKRKPAMAAGNGGSPDSTETTTLSSALIVGEWDATFEAQGTTVPVIFRLQVDGHKVTGTSESAHLGSGKIVKGSWTADKLNFTLEGAFGSILISGVSQHGKLIGEFDAGKMRGKFTAIKK